MNDVHWTILQIISYYTKPDLQVKKSYPTKVRSPFILWRQLRSWQQLGYSLINTTPYIGQVISKTSYKTNDGHEKYENTVLAEFDYSIKFVNDDLIVGPYSFDLNDERSLENLACLSNGANQRAADEPCEHPWQEASAFATISQNSTPLLGHKILKIERVELKSENLETAISMTNIKRQLESLKRLT